MPETTIDEDDETPPGESKVHPPPRESSDAQLYPKPSPPPVELSTKEELGASA